MRPKPKSASRSLSFAVVVALGAVTACSSAGSDLGQAVSTERPGSSAAPATSTTLPPTSTTQPSSTVQPTTTIPSDSVEASYQVALLSNGDEPRYELVLAWTAAAASSELDSAEVFGAELTYINDQQHQITTNGQAQAAGMPLRTETHLDVAASIQRPAQLVIRTDIVDVRVSRKESVGDTEPTDTAVLAEATAISSQAKGLWLEQLYTFDFAQRSPGAPAPTQEPTQNDVLAGYDHALNLLQLAIPQGALGIGANWDATTERERAGLPISVHATATITEIDKRSATADVEIVSTFIPALLEVGGQKVQLIGGTSVLSGTMTWSVDLPVATYDLSGLSTTHLRFDDPNTGKTDLEQTIEQTYHLGPR